MGCMNSRPEFPNELHANLFTAVAVGKGRKNLRCKLEVTGDKLILHSKNRDPIEWPLSFLRRYGYENNIFSIEAGRRCQTGPGIFSFKCSRAEELFYLIQTRCQDSAASEDRLRLSALMHQARIRLESTSSDHPHHHRYSGGSNGYLRPNSMIELSRITPIPSPSRVAPRPDTPNPLLFATTAQTSAGEYVSPAQVIPSLRRGLSPGLGPGLSPGMGPGMSPGTGPGLGSSLGSQTPQSPPPLIDFVSKSERRPSVDSDRPSARDSTPQAPSECGRSSVSTDIFGPDDETPKNSYVNINPANSSECGDDPQFFLEDEFSNQPRFCSPVVPAIISSQSCRAGLELPKSVIGPIQHARSFSVSSADDVLSDPQRNHRHSYVNMPGALDYVEVSVKSQPPPNAPNTPNTLSNPHPYRRHTSSSAALARIVGRRCLQLGENHVLPENSELMTQSLNYALIDYKRTQALHEISGGSARNLADSTSNLSVTAPSAGNSSRRRSRNPSTTSVTSVMTSSTMTSVL